MFAQIMNDYYKNEDWQMLERFFPELALLESTEQNPAFHAEGNVKIHTQMVLAEIKRILDRELELSEEERLVLFHAAVLHDIGKPSTTRIEDGKIISKGHSQRGAIESRRILWKKTMPFSMREQIVGLVANHQRPFYIFDAKKPEYIVHKISMDCNTRLLGLLCEADTKGRKCDAPDGQMDAVNMFRDLCEQELCYGVAKQFPDDTTRFIYFEKEGQISPDYPHYQDYSCRVYLMCGIPASGKSTRANNLGLPIVSFDQTRKELGLKYGKNEGWVVQKTKDKMKELLANKADFIVDATHLSADSRGKTIRLVRQYAGCPICIYVEAPYAEIMQRNQERNGTLTNDKIDQMLRLWEVPRIIECYEVLYE